MSSSILTFKSTIGNAVSYVRTVVLTEHTDSDSDYDRSVVTNKERDWRVCRLAPTVVVAHSRFATEARTQHDPVLEETLLSRRFLSTPGAMVRTLCRRFFSFGPVPHFTDERDGLCPQFPASSSLV